MPEFFIDAHVNNIRLTGTYRNLTDGVTITPLSNSNEQENSHRLLEKKDGTFHTANVEVLVRTDEDNDDAAIKIAKNILFDYEWIFSFAQRRDVFCECFKCYKITDGEKILTKEELFSSRLPFSQYGAPLVRIRIIDFVDIAVPNFRKNKEILTIAIHWLLDSLENDIFEKRFIELWNSFEMLAAHHTNMVEKILHDETGQELARVKLKDITYPEMVSNLKNKINEIVENIVNESKLQSAEKTQVTNKLKNKIVTNFVYEESAVNKIKYLLDNFKIQYNPIELHNAYEIRNKIMHIGHCPDLIKNYRMYPILESYLEKVLLNFLGVNHLSGEFLFNFSA